MDHNKAFAMARMIVKRKLVESGKDPAVYLKRKTDLIHSIAEQLLEREEQKMTNFNKSFNLFVEELKATASVKVKAPGKQKPDFKVFKKFDEELAEDSRIAQALQKKSESSEIDLEILGEVYNRGLEAHAESGFQMSAEQYAFARVNSYISQGKTYFQEDADLHENWNLGSSNSNLGNLRKARDHKEKANYNLKKANKLGKDHDLYNHHMKLFHTNLAKYIKNSYHAGRYGDMKTAKKDYAEHMKFAKEYSPIKEDADLHEALPTQAEKIKALNAQTKKQKESNEKKLNRMKSTCEDVVTEEAEDFKVKDYVILKRRAKKSHSDRDPPMDGRVVKVHPEHVTIQSVGRKGYYKARKDNVFKHDPTAKNKPFAKVEVVKEDTLDESRLTKINTNHYVASSEKSQFGGYTPLVKHKSTGDTMYSGHFRYKSPADAEKHAEVYLNAYGAIGPRHADTKSWEHMKLNKSKLHESTQLDEISKDTAQSYIDAAYKARQKNLMKDNNRFLAAKRAKGIKLASKVLAKEDQVEEEVKSVDKQTVIVPSFTDQWGNTIPAHSVKRKSGRKIIDSGNVHDGK